MKRRGSDGQPGRKRELAHAVVVLLLTCVLAGCGSDGLEEGDDFGNLLASPGGLTVLRVEHPTGWGRPDCFTCHEVRNMHIVNRTDLPNCEDLPPSSPDACIDLAEIQNIIRNQGEASCVQCHGTNGVEP